MRLFYCRAQGPWSAVKIAGLHGSSTRAFPAPGREEQSGVAHPDLGPPLLEGPDKRPQSSLGPGTSAPLHPISGDAHQPRLPFGGLQGQCSSWTVTSGSFPADLPRCSHPRPQHLPGLPERSPPNTARLVQGRGPRTAQAPRMQTSTGIHCGGRRRKGRTSSHW